MNPTHKCAIPACEKQVPFGKLMCLAHWQKVPSHLKLTINHEWHTGGYGGARYNKAVQDAIDAVGGEVAK